VPIKLLCVLAAGVASAGLAYVPTALELAWWWHVLLVAAVCLLVVWWGQGVFLGGALFEEIAWGVKRRWATAYTVAVILHGGWVIGSLAASWWWPGVLVGLVVMDWVVAVLWEYRATRVRPRAQLVRTPVPDILEAELVEPDPPVTADDLGEAVLRHLGYSHYRLVAADPGQVGAGAEDVVVWVCQKLTPFEAARQALREEQRLARLKGRDPREVKPPQLKDLPSLTHNSAEDIANTIMALTGVPMMRDYVQVVPDRLAGRVVVTVATRDVAAEASPFTLDWVGADPSRMTIGQSRRGTPVVVNPCQHWKVIGSTGSGKSALENAIIARLRHGRVVVCGADKVWDLAEEWVSDLGDVDLPVRVVQGLADTLRVLVAMLRLARHIQNLPAAQRSELTPVWVVITESSRVLTDRSLTIEWDGRQYTAGELVGLGARSMLSARIYLVLSAQDFEHEYWGTEAGSIKNNTGLTVLVRSRNADERRRALGDAYYGLPDHAHPGEAYVKDAGEPVYAKLPYPQETAKPRLHDGPTVNEIARALAPHARNFSTDELAAAGLWFASLPRRMTPAYQAYLRGFGPLPGQPQDPAGSDAGDPTAAGDTDALLAEADAMVAGVMARPALPAAAPEHAAAHQPADDTAATVTAVIDRPPLVERIVQLVAEAEGGRMARKAITDAVLAEGYDTSQGSVDNILSNLAHRGRLKRPKGTTGIYQRP
jgi:hypothetical protein